MGSCRSRYCDQRTGNITLGTANMPLDNNTLDTVTVPLGNDALDTVTMARKEREKNGPWEAELSYRGEADLHRHLIDCEKNPGHREFIPVEQFKVEHLPPRYQDQDIVDLVRAISDLTVRVSVNYVSDRRPETVPGSNEPYPCYKNRGSSLMRVGSGLVINVKKNKKKNCDCKECLNSEKPRTNFAHLRIRTAAHVVYDEVEAAHTTCHLFFDSGGTPDACSGVVILSGMTCVATDAEIDRCEMTYVTHDLDLTDKLDQIIDRQIILHSKISNKYLSYNHHKRSWSPAQSISICMYRDMCMRKHESYRFLAIIVSHPHGCRKQVSVGYTSGGWKMHILPKYRANFLYTTATCPGSSGAPVWVCDGDTFFYQNWSAHSGHWNIKLNFCIGNKLQTYASGERPKDEAEEEDSWLNNMVLDRVQGMYL